MSLFDPIAGHLFDHRTPVKVGASEGRKFSTGNEPPSSPILPEQSRVEKGLLASGSLPSA
jgi:hypothetical protein